MPDIASNTWPYKMGGGKNRGSGQAALQLIITGSHWATDCVCVMGWAFGEIGVVGHVSIVEVDEKVGESSGKAWSVGWNRSDSC